MASFRRSFHLSLAQKDGGMNLSSFARAECPFVLFRQSALLPHLTDYRRPVAMETALLSFATLSHTVFDDFQHCV